VVVVIVMVMGMTGRVVEHCTHVKSSVAGRRGDLAFSRSVGRRRVRRR
jgi:hypothetical protein